jgi:hypothetical protein
MVREGPEEVALPVVKPLAYSVSDPALPYKRNSWYRFERLGLIKLHRNGGKTFVLAEDVEGIVGDPHPQPQDAASKLSSIRRLATSSTAAKNWRPS